jgi:hypothetical protein
MSVRSDQVRVVMATAVDNLGHSMRGDVIVGNVQTAVTEGSEANVVQIDQARIGHHERNVARRRVVQGVVAHANHVVKADAQRGRNVLSVAMIAEVRVVSGSRVVRVATNAVGRVESGSRAVRVATNAVGRVVSGSRVVRVATNAVGRVESGSRVVRVATNVVEMIAAGREGSTAMRDIVTISRKPRHNVGGRRSSLVRDPVNTERISRLRIVSTIQNVLLTRVPFAAAVLMGAAAFRRQSVRVLAGMDRHSRRHLPLRMH